MLRSPESEIEIIEKRCFNADSAPYAARFYLPQPGTQMPEELGHGRRWGPPVMVQIERNQPQPGKPLTKFFRDFFQQFSFADPTDSPNTQDWLFGPYVVDPSQSFEEMAQKLPLMVSIGKEFQSGLSCCTLAGGTDGFADWHKC